MKEKKVLVKNIEVNYKVFGEGPLAHSEKPMLILHGWGSSSARWEKTAGLLTQKGIQIVIPDLPGFGETPEPETAWNLDSYVDWLDEFSQKVPELAEEFYLLGHSFGGSLAVKFTVKYNQKVSKLFLISAACVRKVKLSKKIWYRISNVVKVFSFLPGYQLARKGFYKFILRKSDYPYVKEGIMKETYMKVVSEDLSFRLPFIKVLTVIIWGQKDTLTPIGDAEIINSKIQHSKLITIPNVKHSLQLEVPEILAQKIWENLIPTPYNEQFLSLKNII